MRVSLREKCEMLRVGMDDRDDLMLRRERLGGVMREVGARAAQSPRLSRNREGASAFREQAKGP